MTSVIVGKGISSRKLLGREFAHSESFGQVVIRLEVPSSGLLTKTEPAFAGSVTCSIEVSIDQEKG